MNPDNMPRTQGQIVTVGVTGASGAILAQKALALLEDDARVARVHLVVTEAGQRLFAEELRLASGDLKQLPSRILGRTTNKIEILPNKDVGASIASGSYEVDRRPDDAVHVPRAGADRIVTRENVPLGGTLFIEGSEGVKSTAAGVLADFFVR